MPCQSRVEAEHAGAILALHGFEITAVVEHDDAERLEVALASELERLAHDRIRARER
jgi:hypothetical protein